MTQSPARFTSDHGIIAADVSDGDFTPALGDEEVAVGTEAEVGSKARRL
jgi:hypothetical protein